jgi:hypothetical protein
MYILAEELRRNKKINKNKNTPSLLSCDYSYQRINSKDRSADFLFWVVALFWVINIFTHMSGPFLCKLSFRYYIQATFCGRAIQIYCLVFAASVSCEQTNRDYCLQRSKIHRLASGLYFKILRLAYEFLSQSTRFQYDHLTKVFTLANFYIEISKSTGRSGFSSGFFFVLNLFQQCFIMKK